MYQTQRPVMPSDRLQTDAVIQQRPDVQTAVMKLDNELHLEDIEGLKFLCQGLIPGSKLKSVSDVPELSILLEKASVLTAANTFILADLLTYVRRIDVLEDIGYTERDVMIQRRQEPSCIKPFYILLYQIAEELAGDDVRKAKYMYGKVPKSVTVSTGLELFTVMVQHRAVTPENVDLLREIFKTIERLDLVELVERYQKSNGQSVIDDLEETFRRSMNIHGDLTDHRTPSEGGQTSGGFGPSIHDVEVHNIDFKRPVVDSMTNYPPSMEHNAPSAPPESLPPMDPRTMDTGQPQFQSMNTQTSLASIPVVSPAPLDYDENATGIPWKILDTLARNIPVAYWPDFALRLGLHLSDDLWGRAKSNTSHKFAVMRQWLNLPETQAQGQLRTRKQLVQALLWAGSTLMAQQIAEILGVQDALNESMSSQSTAYDTNDVASRGSAAHFPAEAQQRAQAVGTSVPMETSSMQRMGVPSPAAVFRSIVPYYSMTNNPRGFCVIINNRDFYIDPHRPREAKQMINREGTDVDRDKLAATFAQLNFSLVIEDNMTDTMMLRTLSQIAQEDHSQYDVFVCCILTHGVQGALYGCNGITVPIKDLTGPFRPQNCPSLAGKPKLFFMQACQGRDKQPGFPDMQEDSALETDSPPELIPNEADYLLGYATTPGFVSYRSKTRGSWYITKLTEMLNKYSADHDILDILTLVNFEVGKGDAMVDGGPFKQAPAPMYTLRKKLVFSR